MDWLKLLSLKYILLRYIGAVTLITLAGFTPDSSALIFIVIPIAFVSIKFLVYDAIVAAISAKSRRYKVSPWLLVGYGLAVMGDMLFTYSATRDSVDAGFAFFGTFILTPWILAAALLAMAINTHLSRNK